MCKPFLLFCFAYLCYNRYRMIKLGFKQVKEGKVKAVAKPRIKAWSAAAKLKGH